MDLAKAPFERMEEFSGRDPTEYLGAVSLCPLCIGNLLPLGLGSLYPASVDGIHRTHLPSSLWLDSANGHLMVRIRMDGKARLLIHWALCLFDCNTSLYQVTASGQLFFITASGSEAKMNPSLRAIHCPLLAYFHFPHISVGSPLFK